MLSVLLVDDDKDILRSIKAGLELRGCRVDAFDRPSQALDHDPNQYDIAILDIKMPEMNGFELARKLWELKKTLQVCFLTAFEIYEKEAKATLPSLLSHCFLKKPMLLESLYQHIQSHLAIQQLPK